MKLYANLRPITFVSGINFEIDVIQNYLKIQILRTMESVLQRFFVRVVGSL